MLWVPERIFDGESPGKRALRRAAPLAFGLFGAINRQLGMEFREGGSGILTHPYSGITALHIGRYLMQLDSRGDRIPKGSFTTEHSATVFQHINPLEEEAKQSLWHVTRVWDLPITDLSLIQIAPGDLPTHDLKGFFEWQLLPPPVGSKVYLIGFPGFSVSGHGDEFGVKSELTFLPAQVTAVYPLHRGTGMFNYPCFEIDKHVAAGFSGGPVIYEDRLCGLVSGSSSFEEKTWCTTLWPMALLEYDSELGTTTKFSELFARGVIAGRDWHEVKGRISKRQDEQGKPYAYIEI